MGDELASRPPARRSKSTTSIGSLFSKSFLKRKRSADHDDDNSVQNSNDNGSDSEHESTSLVDNSSDNSSDIDSERDKKRAKLDKNKDDESEQREKDLDAQTPAEYRKFRPRGYKFNIPPKDRPIRIYADGVFDLFHLGHMRQLEQAKKALPNVTLVVGVPSDKDTHKYKGLTVLSDKQRCETLNHCKWVDEVIADAPWCVTVEFLKEHKIDYVAHDDLPYASNGDDDIYRPVKELGMFLTTQRTEGISTSDIITRIIRDYDKYLMRNFARGATRKDLNVSWLKKNELDLKRHVLQFRESFKTNLEKNSPRDLYSELLGYVSNALHFSGQQAGGSNTNNNNNSNQESSFFDNVKDWVSKRIDTSHPPSDDSD